jgi:hypothetical protein
MFNQRQLAQSEPVAAVAARSLATTATPAQLLEHVSVDVPANSQILRVRCRDTVPETAQRGADAFAEAYLAFREADARAQAKASQTSLLKDVARLNNQIAQAETVIRSPRATASDPWFLMVVRHPAIVSLSTRKWARLRSLGALLDHWFAAHRRFERDAPFLHHLLLVKYEHLAADPGGTLARIAAFLDLEGAIPADGLDTRRSATYQRQWADLGTTGPWRRQHLRRLCRRHEPGANHFGYSLLDLAGVDPFPR